MRTPSLSSLDYLALYWAVAGIVIFIYFLRSDYGVAVDFLFSMVFGGVLLPFAIFVAIVITFLEF